jgi:hypothetical protein
VLSRVAIEDATTLEITLRADALARESARECIRKVSSNVALHTPKVASA